MISGEDKNGGTLCPANNDDNGNDDDGVAVLVNSDHKKMEIVLTFKPTSTT